MKVKIEFSDLPPLTEYCSCDNGVRRNYVERGDEGVPCTLCRDGTRPTEFGLAVLELIRLFGGGGLV